MAIRPHGGELQQPILSSEKIDSLNTALFDMPSLSLNRQQCCDIELLLNGAFSPLTGFMDQSDYQSVLDTMRLEDKTLWPIPITLDVTHAFADTLATGDDLLIKDQEGVPLAILHVTVIWEPDKKKEAMAIYATDDIQHAGVEFLFYHKNPVYIGGKLSGLQLPTHYNFPHLRQTPEQVRAYFDKMGWQRIVAFQTRNPMHKAHVAMTLHAAQEVDANLLIHPVVGPTKIGDIEFTTRVRCYEKLLKHYPRDFVYLSLLPLAMRMAGPKEALWHAIIRKNYGCTHFIIGRDHAGTKNESTGENYYQPYEAHELAKKHEKELGIEVVYFHEMVHIKENNSYIPITEVKEHHKEHIERISGSQLRQMLKEGVEIPDWFSYPEVIHELQVTNKPKHEQGFTVFFTGLSGAGKSTIANELMIKLHELTSRTTTLLDGDIVRNELARELGFSREHRNMNVLRIAYVASEITKHRGIAICAPIAPYKDLRHRVRQKISQYGGFIEVYVSTRLEVCEDRDRKGLYARARAGKLKEFTGIDDIYEEPTTADVIIDTESLAPHESVDKIITTLKKLGYLRMQ